MANRVVLAFNATYEFHENIASTDNIDMQSGGKVVNMVAATTAGDAISYGQSGASLAGLALTAALLLGGNAIQNVLDPVNPQDAATKNYVDGKINGVAWKNPAQLVATANVATLSGETTIDGVATSASRVLLTAQTTASQNGIWTTGTGAWTRPADFATGAHAADDAIWIEEGTANADTAWVCTTDPPNDVVDTNSLTFINFSTATGYTAGAGLTLTGHTFSVNVAAADGTQIVGGTTVGIKVTATNPGVSLLSDGLQTLVSTTGGLQHTSTGDAILNDPNGGLTSTGTGEAVKPDATTSGNPTVAVGANGLRVIGLPLNFNINSVATSNNVTAANLGTLTGGPTGNADALHAHMQVRGQYVTVSALTPGAPVYWSSTNNEVDLALGNTDSKSFVTGVSLGTYAASATADCVFYGIAAGVLSAATAGTPYYLAPTGGLQTAAPGGGGNRVIMVGFAKNATDLFVNIRDLGKRV